MKKRYFHYLTASILVWVLSGCFIPSTVNNSRRNFPETDDKIILAMKQQGLNSSSPYYLNEINTKAVRNFISNYREATDPQWTKYPGGFVITFRKDSIHNMVYYDKTGDHQCTIRRYSERELPFEIRHMVKSAYYDFSIFHVTEVTVNGKTYYGVNIQYKTSFKEIKIADGVMEVVAEFIKSE